MIIPPHMSKMVIEHREDHQYISWEEQGLQNSENVRNMRELDIKKMPGSPSNKIVIQIFDAENRFFLPGKRIFEPQKSKDDAVKNAYNWAFKTCEFYQTVFDHHSLNRVFSSVHYNLNFNNALFTGKRIVYGEPDPKLFKPFTDFPTITAHELTHQMMQNTKLRNINQSGAIVESYCDIFASMVKQYINDETVNEADWLIGAELLVGGGSLRSLKQPGQAYQNHVIFKNDPQPKTMDAYIETSEDHGGMHTNCSIPSGAFYKGAVKLYDINSEKYARSWESVGRVWYETLEKLLPNTNFAEFSQMTIETADTLFGRESPESKAIREAWREVKIFGHKPPPRKVKKLCLVS